jgi:hypothetical protein
MRWGEPDRRCKACDFGFRPCKGGGNKDCIKRNRLPSVLVGILDTYGGMRVVVTHRKSVRHHVRHDELAIVVPRLRVHEPIAWGDIPSVVRRVEIEIDKWIERHGMPNDPVQHECVTMYRLRSLEQPGSKRSFNPAVIAFT